MTPSQIEAMVEKKVAEILASRAAAEAASAAPVPQPPAEPTPNNSATTGTAQSEISEEVKRRLEALERRIEAESRNKDQDQDHGGRAEGLRLLLQARQAKECGDEEAALGLYERALEIFPGQRKLLGKIERLRVKLGKAQAQEGGADGVGENMSREGKSKKKERRGGRSEEDEDGEYREGTEADVEDDEDEGEKKVGTPARGKGRRKRVGDNNNTKAAKALEDAESGDGPASPRTKQLLDIVNSRDLARIKGLHGFGAKRAQDLVDCLALRGIGESGRVESLAQLRMLPGMGGRAVERAYEGLVVEA
jgi:hypothetical protein